MLHLPRQALPVAGMKFFYHFVKGPGLDDPDTLGLFFHSIKREHDEECLVNVFFYR
jgi:hypothetical protein